jgi:hypothetical protein
MIAERTPEPCRRLPGYADQGAVVNPSFRDGTHRMSAVVVLSSSRPNWFRVRNGRSLGRDAFVT